MCRGEDQGPLDLRTTPALSILSNSALAVVICQVEDYGQRQKLEVQMWRCDVVLHVEVDDC